MMPSRSRKRALRMVVSGMRCSLSCRLPFLPVGARRRSIIMGRPRAPQVGRGDRMLARVRVILSTVLIGTAIAAPGYAQSSSDGKLSDLLPDLLRRTVTLAPPSVAGFPTHEAHFLPTSSD